MFKRSLFLALIILPLISVAWMFVDPKAAYAIPPDCMRSGSHKYVVRKATASDVERMREFPNPAKKGDEIVLIESTFSNCGGVEKAYFYLVKDKRWKDTPNRWFVAGGGGSYLDGIFVEKINSSSTGSITHPWFVGEKSSPYSPPRAEEKDFRISVGGNVTAALSYLSKAENNDPAVENPDLTPGDISAPDGSSELAGTKCEGSGIMGWVLCPVVENLYGAINSISDDFITPLLSVNTLDTSSENQLYSIWKSFRTLANVAFVITFIVVIYSTAVNNS